MATVSTNYARPASEVATSNVDRVTNILHWTYGLGRIICLEERDLLGSKTL